MLKPPWPANVTNGLRRYKLGSNTGSVSTGWVQVLHSAAYSSVKTPNWKLLSKHQRNAIKNPFNWSYGRTTYFYSEVGFQTWTNHYNHGYIYDSVPPANVQSFAPIARSKALSRLQNRVSRSSVNLAQAFAERKQASNMLAKSANRLVNLALDIRRWRFGSAIENITRWTGVSPPKGRIGSRKETFASNWLEFQYGWKPLLSDVYGSCELLARTFHERRPTVVVASATEEFTRKVYSSWLFAEMNITTEWTLTGKETYRYVVEFVEDDALAAALADTGISNPALLAWELVPYSFVVDWFLPVGNYLEQLTYANGLRFIRGTESRRAVLDSVGRHMVGASQPVGSSGHYARGGMRYEWRVKQRTVLTSWPYQRFPPFKPKLGVERTLNAIALLTQILSGGKPRSRSPLIS